jgi:hypothetical protein
MAATTRTIRVTSDTTVDELLADADAAPVRLEKGGVVYRLSREKSEHDIWANYDPERARRALHDVAGIFREIDVDKWIADIYEARKQGSRPIDRP